MESEKHERKENVKIKSSTEGSIKEESGLIGGVFNLTKNPEFIEIRNEYFQQLFDNQKQTNLSNIRELQFFIFL